MKKNVVFFVLGCVFVVLIVFIAWKVADEAMNNVSFEIGNQYLQEKGLDRFEVGTESWEYYIIHIHSKAEIAWDQAHFRVEVISSILVLLICILLVLFKKVESYAHVCSLGLPALFVYSVNLVSIVIILPYIFCLVAIFTMNLFDTKSHDELE
ncbi:hypothetical protein [Bermanella sp. R86510]|uniref:hypothetical protein n=1 Tax=unclassified Bermanella TaxID=2627862 RepID=UPI0037C64BCA